MVNDVSVYKSTHSAVLVCHQVYMTMFRLGCKSVQVIRLMTHTASGLRDTQCRLQRLLVNQSNFCHTFLQPAARIMGYTAKSELIGKNINMIVPPPFSRNHNNYVRNFIQTGEC
jgi:hypothetical protein